MPNLESPNSSSSPIPRLTFVGLSLASLAVMLCLGILLPILSNYAKNLGASGAVVGIIFAGFALSRGIFSPLFGRISDQYGRKNMIVAGLILYVGLSLGYSLLHHLFVLAILWFVQGIASAMVAPIAQSYVGDITPEGKEGRVMNLFYFAKFGGAAIGPVVGGYLIDHFSINAPFYAMFGTTLAALIIILFVVPEAPTTGKNQEKPFQFKKSFLTVLRDRKMKGIISYMVGRGFYRRGFNAFFPVYAVTIASLSESQVGIVLSCYMITGTLLQYPFGWLADRLKDYRAELIVLGGTIAAATMIFIPSFTFLSWLVVLVIIKGIFSTFSRAPTVAVRTERGRIYGMGAVTGVAITGVSAGQIVGPIGFGVISDLFSIPASFYTGAAVGLLTTAVAYWYLRDKKVSSSTNERQSSSTNYKYNHNPKDKIIDHDK
jgi:multidrug resistance protein